ncbi:MAG TPA: hypothetical protein DD706_03105 [Nitrospiraceae bacterium]|nr:hypothetical protein [Nitrospiraceae bacterium]
MNHPSSNTITIPCSQLAHTLIVLLIGLHVALLGAGAFCTSKSQEPTSAHHSNPATSTSILCSWACHVTQISSGASPASHFAILFLSFLFWSLKPVFTFSRTVPFHSFSPRGPPLLSPVHG